MDPDVISTLPYNEIVQLAKQQGVLSGGSKSKAALIERLSSIIEPSQDIDFMPSTNTEPEEDAADEDAADEDVVEEDVVEEDAEEEDVVEEDVVEEDAADEDVVEEDVVEEDAADEDVVAAELVNEFESPDSPLDSPHDSPLDSPLDTPHDSPVHSPLQVQVSPLPPLASPASPASSLASTRTPQSQQASQQQASQASVTAMHLSPLKKDFTFAECSLPDEDEQEVVVGSSVRLRDDELLDVPVPVMLVHKIFLNDAGQRLCDVTPVSAKFRARYDTFHTKDLLVVA